MRIHEIITENYVDSLVDMVADLLAAVMAKGMKKISTERFRELLAKQGYVTTIEEIIQAVDQSGFASSVNADFIVPADELPDGLGQDDQEDSVDVSDMANQAATQAINQDDLV
jgi:hypothetical protein